MYRLLEFISGFIVKGVLYLVIHSMGGFENRKFERLTNWNNLCKEVVANSRWALSRINNEDIISRSSLRSIESNDHQTQEIYQKRELNWETKYAVKRKDNSIESIGEDEYNEAIQRIKKHENAALDKIRKETEEVNSELDEWTEEFRAWGEY